MTSTSSSAIADQPLVRFCPCGLPYEDVKDACKANGFICTAPQKDGRPCGERLADHPRERHLYPASGTKSDKLLLQVLKKQDKTMSAVLEVLEEIGDKDCYDRISESSKPRALSKTDYEAVYGVPAADLACMITGISQNSLIRPSSPTPKNPVTVSHLLARSAEAKERLSLGYGKADIDNIRNSILLCKGIEEAFDHKLISFVPTDKPFSNNRYKMYIWVDAIKLEPIYEGATQTIGMYDGFDLNLTVGVKQHNPFKRALSYQAFRAFKMWGKGFGLTKLPEDCDTSVYEGAYKLKRVAYAKQLAKDAEADAEDADEAVEV